MKSHLKSYNKIEVFTDGSCSDMTKKIRKCGYGIHFVNDEIPDVSKPFLHEPMTNQRAELYAIYKALKIIHNKYACEQIIIYSDSMYSINCATIWIKTWKQNGWKNSQGHDVANSSLIKKIDKYISKLDNKVEFKHVKAHTGKTDFYSRHNDIADKLASNALKISSY